MHIHQKDEWRRGLFKHMGVTRGRFQNELKLISDYRNKYVAHLDDPIQMNYPHTNFMCESASFLHYSLKNDVKTKEPLQNPDNDTGLKGVEQR